MENVVRVAGQEYRLAPLTAGTMVAVLRAWPHIEALSRGKGAITAEAFQHLIDAEAALLGIDRMALEMLPLDEFVDAVADSIAVLFETQRDFFRDRVELSLQRFTSRVWAVTGHA